MEIIRINRLDNNPEILNNLRQKRLLLWVLPGCTEEQLLPLLKLPWVTAWNDCPQLDFTKLWDNNLEDRQREPFVVESPDQDPDELRTTDFLRVYQLHPLTPKNGSTARKWVRYAEQLRDKIEEYTTGIITFIGSNLDSASLDKVVLAHDLAPRLPITLITQDSITSPIEGDGIAYQWTKSTTHFREECQTLIVNVDRGSLILDLKDVSGMMADAALLEDLSNYWTLLSRGLTNPPQDVSQEDFDRFVNGEEIWSLYALEAAYRRKCYQSEQHIDFIEQVIEKIRNFEKDEVGPTDQLRQFLLFSESGSGVTTLLRQTAMALAKSGYPTLMAKSFSQGFGGRSLENFIVDVQDKWQDNRHGKGSGIGLLPVCLVLDTDAETSFRSVSLARQLSGLGRRVVLIRALEKTKKELSEAKNVYTLPAEVSEAELIALGKHLGDFCSQRQLVTIPTEGEWRAYYEGMNRLYQFPSPLYDAEEEISIPPLFLIGIYPFIKEHISDQNSLEQYYYQKWQDLSNPIQEIVKVLAAAMAYGIGIPYDTLRRHPLLDLSELEKSDKENQRKIDTFIDWKPWSGNWRLRIRHPAMGRLLSAMIDPYEGEAPYSALLPLLERLTTKEEDRWFAEMLAFRLGQYFKTGSPQFSIETDTSIQRAARIIFNTIPRELKDVSRIIRHHEGRYHLHILHACAEVLDHPNLTTLPREVVLDLAQEEYRFAQKKLEQALNNNNSLEPDSNIYNTMAIASFKLASVIQSQDSRAFRTQFKSALQFQENAIISDPANGYALSQFVRETLKALENGKEEEWPLEEQLELFTQVESRLVELIRLHSEKRWRNIEPEHAEMQLETILSRHVKVSKQLLGETANSKIKITNPEMILFLETRQTLGKLSLREGFREDRLAKSLRQLREKFLALPKKSARVYLYVYRLYMEDPVARLKFKERLELLEQLRKQAPRQHLPFRHDEATLLCQFDKIDIGNRKFKELRASRQADPSQWIWQNERVLVDGNGNLREMTLTADSPEKTTGYARILNTGISVMYKPHQFDKDFSKGEPFKAYLRFTLNGLQAVPKKLANFDRQEMGLV
jgi:DNA-dependent RNA polymerase auxiliary subunit epsilon